MPVHVPDWIEDNAKATDNWIVFRCRTCGTQAAGNRKQFENGKWLPPMGKHT